MQSNLIEFIRALSRRGRPVLSAVLLVTMATAARGAPPLLQSFDKAHGLLIHGGVASLIPWDGSRAPQPLGKADAGAANGVDGTVLLATREEGQTRLTLRRPTQGEKTLVASGVVAGFVSEVVSTGSQAHPYAIVVVSGGAKGDQIPYMHFHLVQATADALSLSPVPGFSGVATVVSHRSLVFGGGPSAAVAFRGSIEQPSIVLKGIPVESRTSYPTSSYLVVSREGRPSRAWSVATGRPIAFSGDRLLMSLGQQYFVLALATGELTRSELVPSEAEVLAVGEDLRSAIVLRPPTPSFEAATIPAEKEALRRELEALRRELEGLGGELAGAEGNADAPKRESWTLELARQDKPLQRLLEFSAEPSLAATAVLEGFRVTDGTTLWSVSEAGKTSAFPIKH